VNTRATPAYDRLTDPRVASIAGYARRPAPPAERRVALALPRALALGAEAARDGGDPVAAARAALDEEPGLKTQYVALADYAGPRLLAAVQVGKTRLIDNLIVHLEA